MIYLSGQLTCTTLEDLEAVLFYLPDHIRLSRAEPGCLRFDVVQTDDPLIWQVDEVFVDQAAFDAHQTRTKVSLWYTATAQIARSFQMRAE